MRDRRFSFRARGYGSNGHVEHALGQRCLGRVRGGVSAGEVMVLSNHIVFIEWDIFKTPIKADKKGGYSFRWLEPTDRPRAAFQSFGEGPRICLGMRLAYLEEKVVLLKLLSRFRIEKTTSTVWIMVLRSKQRWLSSEPDQARGLDNCIARASDGEIDEAMTY